MSDDCSSGSSDEGYVNFGAKYRKAMKKKIRFRKEEDDTPTYYNKPYEPAKSPPPTPKRQHEPEKVAESSPEKRSHTESDTLDLTDNRDSTSESRSPGGASGSSNTTMSSAPLDDPINLDSSQDNSLLNTSDYILCGSPEENKIEDENYSEKIKIIWMSKEVIKLDVKRFDPLEKIFKHFAQLKNVPESRIIITRNQKPLKPTDTPESLGLSIVDVLDGGITDSNTVTSALKDDDENVCKVKVQSANTKEPVFVNLKRNQDFKSVAYECARKYEVPPENIKLYFDGEQIDLTETPDSLDLEQEACIDLRITK